ncbi:MAG: 5'/3'-nucleotidase SurE [Anaerolineaceae bacterium]|nr:5'/3'-nucleotidase SurE [Anaerolineaceae bacterium]
MTADKFQILLTNDDGIQSPGLWAAAEALSGLGFVTVAAPREQSSGAGRGLPSTSDGIIRALKLRVHDKDWTVYSVGGTPAQAVQHAIFEIMPRRPDLVVSGINYGENVGSGVTISGTVGAALEGAALGVPGLAMSLETTIDHHSDLSLDVDFSVAGYFTRFFGQILLEKRLPFDVDVLKVDVPAGATPETPWEITRVARHSYYRLMRPTRTDWEQAGRIGYQMAELDPADVLPDSDVYALRFKKVVSVTPLSLDLTSRVEFGELDRYLRE